APQVTDDQRESWAQGSYYISSELGGIVARGEDNLATEWESVTRTSEVAHSLSRSIGEPAEVEPDYETIIAGLERQLAAERSRYEKLKDWHRRNSGKPIEGTGISLWSITTPLGLIAFVAAIILIPGAGTLAI